MIVFRDSVGNVVVKDRDLVDEIIHIDCCKFSRTTVVCKPIRDVLVRDAISNYRINWVLFSANPVYSLEHLGNLF